MSLIEEANKEYRRKPNRTYTKRKTATPPTNTITDVPDSEDENMDMTTNHNELQIKIEDETSDESYVSTKTIKKQQIICCACGTTTNDPTAVFYSVSYSEQKENPTSASNAVQKSYYRKEYQRKVFLSRLGLCQNDKRKGLKICENHKLEVTSISYEWKDAQESWSRQPMTCKYLLILSIHPIERGPRRQSANHQILRIIENIKEIIQQQSRLIVTKK
jgi:hypothetical protein